MRKLKRDENISVNILTGDQWTVDCSLFTPLYLPKHAIRADARQKVVTSEEAIKCRGSGASHRRKASYAAKSTAIHPNRIEDRACCRRSAIVRLISSWRWPAAAAKHVEARSRCF